jgi:hypothetical protein
MTNNRAIEISKKKFEFLYEQDGIPERELKRELCKIFQCDMRIKRGYLARVKYADSETAVALCLRALPDHNDFLNKINNIFASMFGSTQYLDIIFLTVKQENQLEKVCCPFYNR